MGNSKHTINLDILKNSAFQITLISGADYLTKAVTRADTGQLKSSKLYTSLRHKMFQLSRVAARSICGQSQLLVRPLSTTSAKLDQSAPIFANEKGPERDLVNFPRRQRPLYPGKVRHLWIPEEWFTFFHEKTGVTGPYMAAASITTFLVSKEIWVIEHEFYCGLAIAICIGGIVKATGADISAALDKAVDAEEANSQWMATSYQELMEAKKENVGLQLELEYRSRLNDAYKQVKRRLDYQLATANVLRAAEQKHMVQWIIDNVRKSITAKQETDALKACVADLKALAK